MKKNIIISLVIGMGVFGFLGSVFRKNEVMPVKAEKEISRINKLRANHYKYYTEKDWKEPSNYDICINSDAIGIDNAVNLICDMVKNLIK